MKNINTLLSDDIVVPTLGSGGRAPLVEITHQANEVTDGEVSTGIERKASRVTRSSATKALARDEFLLMKTQQAKEGLGSKKSEMMLQMGISEWNKYRRGLPKSLAMSGLFTAASANSPRAAIRGQVIASLSNYVVTYSGMELRQDDLSVWLAIVSMGRKQPLGEPIHFTAHSLIKDLGWHVHSDTYKLVKEVIERLKFTSVMICAVDHKSKYAGSFIRDYLFDDIDIGGNPCWMVRLEESITRLFLEDTITLSD